MLHSWWEKHLTPDSRSSIKHAIKRDEDGTPIFDERTGMRISDAVNTLFYTIIQHFTGTPNHITSQIHDQLSN